MSNEKVLLHGPEAMIPIGNGRFIPISLSRCRCFSSMKSRISKMLRLSCSRPDDVRSSDLSRSDK